MFHNLNYNQDKVKLFDNSLVQKYLSEWVQFENKVFQYKLFPKQFLELLQYHQKYKMFYQMKQ